MFSVLIGALYSLFYGTLRLREKTSELTETSVPRDYIVGLINRDLAHIVAPVGILAGPLIGESDEEGGERLDRLEFYTASGIVNTVDPWAEVQKVEYYLDEPEDTGETEGQELVRAVTRNLLAATAEEPEEQRLLSGVQSLEFAYYDGEYWEDVWDSTTQESETPRAIMMYVDFVAPQEGDRQMRPIELVCELVTEPFEVQGEDQAGGDEQGGGQSAGGGSGGPGSGTGTQPPDGGGRP